MSTEEDTSGHLKVEQRQKIEDEASKQKASNKDDTVGGILGLIFVFGVIAYAIWITHNRIGWDRLFTDPIGGFKLLGEFERMAFLFGGVLLVFAVPILILLLFVGAIFALDKVSKVIWPIIGGLLLWGVFEEAGIWTCLSIGFLFLSVYFFDKNLRTILSIIRDKS